VLLCRETKCWVMHVGNDTPAAVPGSTDRTRQKGNRTCLTLAETTNPSIRWEQ
jgi:hypothetical protein